MSERNVQTDLVQVGLTAEARGNLEVLMRTGWFNTAQDVYLLAITVALANDVIASQEQVRGAETRYSYAGGLDKDGKLRALINAFRPEDAAMPARTAERLAHAGLAILTNKLSDEDALLSEALGFREGRADG